MDTEYETIKVETSEGICSITLNRPEVHNAFNAAMIRELREVFEWVTGAGPGVARVVVLSGEGRSFCAGADVNWMRESRGYTRDENRADAARMEAMFRAIDRCPVPVITRVHNLALGGGAGLVAVSDIVIAEERTQFAFSEVRLGIAPSVISPFVLSKIGTSHARALFLTGERFGAERALRMGLVHVVVPEADLGAEVERSVEQAMSAAPGAVARAKELVASVPRLASDEARDLTIDTIAELRAGTEGQEGLAAFLEKRKPEWAR
jgi:methylglutaconyl-CoA hydratase